MQDFKELKVWSSAHQFVLEIYRETRTFPADERFGLTAQIRRSASSIPSNIAEGSGRRTRPDFARHVDFALGSANETEYHLILARDLGLLRNETYRRLTDKLKEIRMMATSLAGALRTPVRPSS